VHPPCLSIGRLECDLFSIRRSTDRPRVYLYSAPIDRTSSRLSVDDQRYTVMPLDRHDVVGRDYETFRITPLLRDRTILIADERGWWLGLPRVLDSKKYSSNVSVLEYSFNSTPGRIFQFSLPVFQINEQLLEFLANLAPSPSSTSCEFCDLIHRKLHCSLYRVIGSLLTVTDCSNDV